MDAKDLELLDALKEKYLSSDNKACFYEREAILQRLAGAYGIRRPGYAEIVATLLSELSAPFEDEDVFAGRMVEARPEPEWAAPHSQVIANPGHLHMRYDDILQKGMRGILQHIEQRAEEKGDPLSKTFATFAKMQIEALDGFAKRYAKAARQKAEGLEGEARARFLRMAAALEVVPMEPAYDLFSALQSVWMIHFVASCVSGARDYGFGRPDQYLLPYYEKDLKDGTLTQEQADTLLAFFLLKANEICGTGTYNYDIKPIPSQSSKQYLTVGGCNAAGKSMANAATHAILRAEMISNMPQPVVVARVQPGTDPAYEKQVYEAMALCTDKMHIYHDRLIYNVLREKGLPEDVAADFTFSGCCSLEVNWRSIRNEWFLPVPHWLCETLGIVGDGEVPEYQSVEEIIEALKANTRRHIEREDLALTLTNQTGWRVGDWRGHTFDAMFMGECADRCRYPLDGGVEYHIIDVNFSGAATVIDSLTAIQKLVFEEKRYMLAEFVTILRDNFEGHELLQAQLKNKFPKFGNDDPEGDALAGPVMNALIDVLDEMDWPEGYIPLAGIYSLHHHNNFGWEMPATPDGRMAGEAYSENQSPVYGADKKGVTALLNSLAKFPFHRAPAGGVNLTFSTPVSPQQLQAITEAYFKMGGLHIAFTVVNRATLEAALENPDAYRTLTVRLFGFSEYFINAAKWQQLELIERTPL